MDTAKLGNLGEKLAAEYLAGKGFAILEKNYKISFGEIDLIAQKKSRLFGGNDNTIHFVEVKTILSSGGPDSKAIADPRPFYGRDFFPEQRVDYKKRRKLVGLCQIWLKKNKFSQDHPHQIDIIGIVVDETTRQARLHYFGNVVAES